MKKPSRISPKEVLQSWLINIVLHLLEKKNKGNGGLINFVPRKLAGGGLIWEGGLIKDLQYLLYSLLYLLELFALTAFSSPCRKDQFAVLWFSTSYCADSGLQLRYPAPLKGLSLWTCWYFIFYTCSFPTFVEPEEPLLGRWDSRRGRLFIQTWGEDGRWEWKNPIPKAFPFFY